MLNVKGSPSVSLAVGVKLYGAATLIEVTGCPEIVGGALGGLDTVMEKGANDADATPSFTVMMMFEYVPTFAVAGVPASWPELVLNVAHAGLPEIENVSV
jgi:hypothetical protein